MAFQLEDINFKTVADPKGFFFQLLFALCHK